MSSKEVARVINHFVREGLDLLRSSDGSALFDFVEEYLCGDDPDDQDDLPQVRYRFNRKQLYQTHSGTYETEDGDLATANTSTFITLNNACINLTKSKLDSYGG